MKWFVSILLSLSVGLLHAEMTFESPTLEAHLGLDDSFIIRDFSFSNTGDKPITIKKADAGCSCMSVELGKGKFTYAPGEKGILRAKFEVGNFQGNLEKTIFVWLEGDPAEQASSKAVLRIFIPSPFSLEPKTLKWKKGEPNETKIMEVKIDSPDSLQIISAKVSSQAFELKLITLEESKHYQIQVTPKSTELPSLGVIQIGSDSKIEKFKSLQGFAVITNS